MKDYIVVLILLRNFDKNFVHIFTIEGKFGMIKNIDNNDLKASFNYLYMTYFGESQIEKEEINRLPELLRDCKVFIDVGASLGMYTYYANKFMDNGDIISIEADPDRAAELKSNCLKWGIKSNNRIRVIHAIAGDSRDTSYFFKTGSYISGGVFMVSERSDNYERVEVPQLILDDYYNNLKTVIKIDVEGSEYRVLKGASKFLEDHNNTKFIIGIHSWGDRERGKMPIDLLKFLYSRNLSITKTTNHLTANYLFEHKGCSKSSLLFSYLRYTPLLLARQIYRNVFPKPVILFIERKSNMLRKKKIVTNKLESQV